MMEHFSPEDIAAIKNELLSSLHCALPGIVESFDAETQTAVVQLGVKYGDIQSPLLRDVPVFMPVAFDIHPGDLCLLVFADCDIDAWLESGEIGEPASGRMHSLSDAFAFIGFKRSGDGS